MSKNQIYLASSSSSDELSINPNWRRFFKVMTRDFDTKLFLPPAFCKHMSLERSREAVLTTLKGSWRIDLCKDSEKGQIYFGNGWEKFVKKHDLHLYDFVLFQHLEKLSFQVQVFDFSTNCEKQFRSGEKTRKLPSNPPKRQKKVPVAVDHSAAAAASLDFSLTMKPSNLRRWSPSLTIPVSFWRSHGLFKQGSLVLRGPSKEPQKVKLSLSRSLQLSMTATGWREFSKSYNLQEGDVCRFKINGMTDEAIPIMDVEINPN